MDTVKTSTLNEQSAPRAKGLKAEERKKLLQKKITKAEAGSLVIAALTPQQRQLPGVSAELGEAAGEVSVPSRFLLVMVVWQGPPEGSAGL